jgi:hypothetical protein
VNNFTLGVAVTIARTVASCQRSGTIPDSVSGESLFKPGVSVDVITAELPEAGLVAFGELKSVYPFR